MEEKPLCDSCGLAPAAVRIEVQKDGGIKTQGLCWACVAQLSASYSLDGQEAAKSCPQCGTTWKKFKHLKVFGCPQCYQTFENELRAWMEKKGYGFDYHGPGPQKQPAPLDQGLRKKELEEALAQALGQEKYEEAAALRDELKQLAEDS